MRSLVGNVLKTGFGLGLLAYMVSLYWESQGDNPGIKDLLQSTPDYSLLAFTFSLTLITLTCQILRWYILVRALGLPFTLRNAFRLGMVGYFFNTLLPGSVSGDFLKAVFIAKDQPSRRAAAVASVVVDRMLGLFGLLMFASLIGGGLWLAGDARIADNPYLRKIVVACTVLVLLAVVGWIVIGLLPEWRREGIGQRVRGFKYVGPTLADLWQAALLYRRQPKMLYWTLPLTAFAQSIMILYFHLAVQVFPNKGVASFTEHFVIGPIGFIAQAFFPAPGGVGGAEAIFGYLYTLVNQRFQTGFAGRLTMRISEYTIAAMGFIVYLSIKAELPATKEPPEAKEPVATT